LAGVVLSHLGQKEYQYGNPNFSSSNRIPNHRSRAGSYDHALAEGLAVMAALIATAKTESSHYYLASGESCHGDLRSARKVGAFPSVTTILAAAGPQKTGLINWQVEQAMSSSLTLPHIEGESLADFAKRAVLDSRKEVEAAALRGTHVHSLAEMIINRQEPGDLVKGYEEHYAGLKEWRECCVTKVHASESVLVNEAEGYAGRVDLIAQIHGEMEVIDFKTRKFKKDAKGISKASGYETDLLQLSAYAYAFTDDGMACRNILIDPVTGQLQDIRYTAEQVAQAFEAFTSICKVWRWLKKYDPREVRCD
jgi:CRISPR/Cas system-associated exonuclease Cas4 (RecB family)